MNLLYKPTNNLFKAIFVFLIFFSNLSLRAQQLAFPSASGAGAYTTGGRGGIIVHVTNLNSDGEGSLKEAIEDYGDTPRIIVFDVSGVINLTSMIYADNSNSNFTILGQTAPVGGITIDGDRVYFQDVDNIIVRHIRIKGGTDGDLDPNSVPGDGLGTSSYVSAGGATNQIFDHVSFAFGNDETAEWYTTQNQDVENLTIQKCFFSQGLKGGIVGKGIGNVILEDYVDVGAGTTIDRATMGSTIIRSGVKLDNQIQIAHNVEIGKNTVIAAQTGVAGSTKIGEGCKIGGQVGIAGHLVIGNNVKVQAQSGIGRNVKDNEILQGSPSFGYSDWSKSYVYFKNLPKLAKTINELEKKVNGNN